MAGPISSKISAALATVYNENSAALATLNIDFTLLKVEVPAEYARLGTTISRKRKADAEEGTLHKTARRLGALFEESLPPAEELFKAYGVRVSEISSMPGINPREGSEKDGIFASHVGADTTSIWAAATSGSAAIAVHLLACMLARMFTGPEATSLWVELVQKQKEWIRSQQNSRLYSHEHLGIASAAQQDISRTELANWDASARAWLQSADLAMQKQHKQTKLILDNANLPVNAEPQTYSSVMKAWITALEAMNSLVKGIPQRARDGAPLLAISSWHLYPDMIVYGGSCVEVKQNDPIFDRAALLTLGLEDVRDDTKSVYWSLPLACLQYYGYPIQASRTVGLENSRITYQQFAFVVLGCLFNGWKDYATTNEEGLQWIDRLATRLGLSTQRQYAHAHRPTWLIYILVAARRFGDCEGAEIIEAQKLMNLGRRWSTFLHPLECPPPLFGLSQIRGLLAVLKSDQERVQCLRQLASHLELNGSNFFIRYVTTKEGWIEYATVVPLERVSSKRTHDGEVKLGELLPKKNARWIKLYHNDLVLCNRRREDLKDIPGAIRKLKQLQELEGLGGTSRPSTFEGLDVNQGDTAIIEKLVRLQDIRELRQVIAIGQRRLEIENRDELFLPVAEYVKDPNIRHHEPRRSIGLIISESLDFMDAISQLMVKVENLHGVIPQYIFAGDENIAALYSVNKLPCQKANLIPGAFLEEFFTASNISPDRLYSHFASNHLLRSEIACLRACAMMAEIYHLLPGATISTLIVRQSLNGAKWIPASVSESPTDSQTLLTLPQAFACVAMFESGTCNLDPHSLSEVFAMSSGNSLYVAGPLLCDPYEQPSPTEIRRVVGNVGRAGITFLISPSDVKTRRSDPEKWMAINHNRFDGAAENYFQQTSIHLSFTDYEIPLIAEESPRHIIDRAVVLVETLLSVYDRGAWVGEVDILKAFRSQVHRVQDDPTHIAHQSAAIAKNGKTYRDALLEIPQLTATSIESWDELIEAPCTGAIAIKAHKNWLARLAAMAICVKQNFTPVILPEEVCWACCGDMVAKVSKNTNNKLAFIC